jgi:hypothetical protein
MELEEIVEIGGANISDESKKDLILGLHRQYIIGKQMAELTDYLRSVTDRQCWDRLMDELEFLRKQL